MTAYKLWDDNHKDLAAHWRGVFDQTARALERR
jgi:hypothetical protein